MNQQQGHSKLIVFRCDEGPGGGRCSRHWSQTFRLINMAAPERHGGKHEELKKCVCYLFTFVFGCMCIYLHTLKKYIFFIDIYMQYIGLCNCFHFGILQLGFFIVGGRDEYNQKRSTSWCNYIEECYASEVILFANVWIMCCSLHIMIKTHSVPKGPH